MLGLWESKARGNRGPWGGRLAGQNPLGRDLGEDKVAIFKGFLRVHGGPYEHGFFIDMSEYKKVTLGHKNSHCRFFDQKLVATAPSSHL